MQVTFVHIVNELILASFVAQPDRAQIRGWCPIRTGRLL